MLAVKDQYQVGYYLKTLRGFIEFVVGPRIAKKMSAEMGAIKFDLVPKNYGAGLDILTQRYTAEFLFEGFPFKQFNPAALFANVGAWLMDNDNTRKKYVLDDPITEIIVESENTAEIGIEIDFIEPIMVVPNDAGNVLWRGQRYEIASYEVWVAKNISVDVVVK